MAHRTAQAPCLPCQGRLQQAQHQYGRQETTHGEWRVGSAETRVNPRGTSALRYKEE